MLFSKTITTLGFLVIVTGIYKIYHAIQPESKTYILAPGEKPFVGAVVDHKRAREGVRFVLYGFIIQTFKLII